MNEPLSAEIFAKGLKTRSFGRNFYSFSEVTSTNDVAAELIRKGLPEGTLIIAEAQTKGRGRQGRRWTTSSGKALAFSLVLYPRVNPDKIPGITLAAAVGVALTLEEYGLEPGIKWPNDILLGGKKLSGILTEMGPRRDNRPSVILGIGINLNQKVSDFPNEIRTLATSFYRASGKRVDRAEFLRKLMKNLEKSYGWWNKGSFARVLKEWRKRSVTLGQKVRVENGSDSFEGLVTDMDADGFLRVLEDSGKFRKVLSGDVILLKKPVSKRHS
jgi:BirA family biotin operon repressor/biotin-[acetyl-CoA-carboxylase] ligase